MTPATLFSLTPERAGLLNPHLTSSQEKRHSNNAGTKTKRSAQIMHQVLTGYWSRPVYITNLQSQLVPLKGFTSSIIFIHWENNLQTSETCLCYAYKKLPNTANAIYRTSSLMNSQLSSMSSETVTAAQKCHQFVTGEQIQQGTL